MELHEVFRPKQAVEVHGANQVYEESMEVSKQVGPTESHWRINLPVLLFLVSRHIVFICTVVRVISASILKDVLKDR